MLSLVKEIMPGHQRTILKFVYSLLVFSFAFNSLAHAKSESEVTHRLIAEGFKVEQSRVDSLLNMIEKGESWDSYDPYMAYRNLSEFEPYSEATEIKILNLISKGLNEGNTLIRYDALVMHYLKPWPRLAPVLDKMAEVMRRMAASEEKRILAFALARSAPYAEEGAQTLHELLKQLEGQGPGQILTAYNLISIKRFTLAAELTLENLMRDEKNVKNVFFYAEIFATELSPRLLGYLETVIPMHSEAMQRVLRKYLNSAVDRIFEAREENQKACAAALTDNVRPFRRPR